MLMRGNVVRGTALALKASYPEKVELTYGDSLRINVSLEYRGLRLEATLYGAIGVWRGITWPVDIGNFDEKVIGRADVTFPESDTFVPWSGSVDIPITADIQPGVDYDIYCKIEEYPGAGMPKVDAVIDIAGIPPTYRLLEETIYPYAYIYSGDCDVTTFTATSIPFTPSSWVSGKMAAAVEQKVREAGGRIMEMRVYVDDNLFRPWTNWIIEVVTQAQTPAMGALGAWWLGPAIILALLAVIVIATPWVIKSIPGLFKSKPGLDKVKIGWKKNTLILTIQNSEEFWERTPTPLEALQGMSEEDLRHYLNKIAEEEVPSKVNWWPIAIAGAAVVGVVLLTSRRD